MTAAALILLLVVLGPGMVALGIRQLRPREWRQRAPAGELPIDRAFGARRPASHGWDYFFARLNGWLAVLFGATVSLVVLASLFSSFVQE
jgi:hypothetical protein